MKELTNQLNFIIKPLSVFLIVALLFLFTLVFAIQKINDIRTKISDGKKIESSLNNKISTLQTVDKKIAQNITFVDMALPSKSSALYAINQVKVKASQNNVVVSNLRSGNADLVSFDVDGNILNIFSFLESFSTSLPIMNITKTKINLVGETSKATVSLNVYSTELPQKIPSVTTPINSLTPEEESLLLELSKYDLPQFIEPKPSEETNLREDPFN